MFSEHTRTLNALSRYQGENNLHHLLRRKSHFPPQKFPSIRLHSEQCSHTTPDRYLISWSHFIWGFPSLSIMKCNWEIKPRSTVRWQRSYEKIPPPPSFHLTETLWEFTRRTHKRLCTTWVLRHFHKDTDDVFPLERWLCHDEKQYEYREAGYTWGCMTYSALLEYSRNSRKSRKSRLLYENVICFQYLLLGACFCLDVFNVTVGLQKLLYIFHFYWYFGK